jgi:hypothetical protein
MRSTFRVLLAALALGPVIGCGEQAEPPTDSQASDPTNPSGEPTSDTSDPTEGGECEGPDGCYDCPPTQHVHVINACTDASCEPFPNTKERLPLLNDDGSLPPLP